GGGKAGVAKSKALSLFLTRWRAEIDGDPSTPLRSAQPERCSRRLGSARAPRVVFGAPAENPCLVAMHRTVSRWAPLVRCPAGAQAPGTRVRSHELEVKRLRAFTPDSFSPTDLPVACHSRHRLGPVQRRLAP